MPTDSAALRKVLSDCLPSLIITAVAKESGQRVVYFGYFDDSQLPSGLDYMKGWASWGPIVIKVSSGIDPTSITYLQREIAILEELSSPYYPKLRMHEIFHENPLTEEKLSERIFVTVEERVDAAPLSALKDKYNNEGAVIQLLLRICAALTLLWNHKKKLVHRDLKPDNILIRPNGNAVIIDLGIMREEGAIGITQPHAPWGPLSWHYASPEQATNDRANITFKSDFFALGIISYELLANHNPFVPSASASGPEILHNILNTHPARLDKIGVASKEFSDLLQKLLEKQPFRRHRTVDLLIDDLKKNAGETL